MQNSFLISLSILLISPSSRENPWFLPGLDPGRPPSRQMTYQETEVLETESWGLVNVVHQAARGGHHDVGQAAEAVCSVEQRVAQRGPRALTK